MYKLIRLLGSALTIALVVTACNITSPATQNLPSVIQIQATPTLAKLELAVQVDTSLQYTAVGQNVKFIYAVKNTGGIGVAGTVVMTGAVAVCPALTTVGNLNDSLDSGETVTCTTDYPITQADLDKGSVAIVATATINGMISNQATVTVPVGQPKVLTVTVTANPTAYSQANQKITFTYTIKNGGGATLGPTQFTISDSLISTTPFACGNPNTSLPPNQTVTCTADYPVTQADMGLASITNVASASGGGISSLQPASTTVNKGTATNPTNLTAGSTISHTVINGEWIWQIARCYGADPNKIVQANSQLSDPSQIKKDMVLTIPNIGSNGKIWGPPCVVTHTVANGDTWNSIAQLYNADPNILQMIKSNSLTVGSVVIVPKNSAGSTTPSTGTKVLSLTTSANPPSYDQVGQQITFTYVIKNTGSTTLGPDQFKVSDSLLSNQAFNCGNPNSSLAPNITITCTSIYTITQADLNLASIANLASASGGGAPQSQAASATVNKGTKALTLTTSANPATYDQAGQQITFTYVIKNNGNTNLGPTQFTVNDTLIGSTPLNCGPGNTSLAPTTTVTCTFVYIITQADLNLASITNRAITSGGGAGPSAEASTTINKVVKALSLTVTASSPTYNQVGQQITLTYIIKNSGTATLGPTQFTISDSLIGPTAFNCGTAGASLASNATISCTATYSISQTDMNLASITNRATTVGGGAPTSPEASVTINRQ